MYIHPCRYNLIEGELRIDTTDEQIVFVRHSLGEKEIYATWSLTEVKKFEIESGLLTQEVVLILQSNEVLRFASNEIQPNIKDWIENRKPISSKKSNSKPSVSLESKSTRPKKKKSKHKTERKKSKQNQNTILQSTAQSNPFDHIKENLEKENTESLDDLSKVTILQREEKKTSLDSSHNVQEIDDATESFNDIANIFREMKHDLTSNQSSFEDNTGTSITHKINKSSSSPEEEGTEQNSCCSNWIVWLIVFLFMVQCLGS